MLFLVRGYVTTTYYMVDDKEDKTIELRLVEADSEEEASTKFSKYFEDMTDEYSVYYKVNVERVSGVIR